jgi:hypothetical protein
MSETSTLIGYGGRTIGREELALVPTPAATETHRLGEFLETKFSVLLTERHSPEDRESDPSTRAFELVECAE